MLVLLPFIFTSLTFASSTSFANNADAMCSTEWTASQQQTVNLMIKAGDRLGRCHKAYRRISRTARLSLSGKFSDLSPISQIFPGMKKLSLTSPILQDLSALSGLGNLKTLELHGTNISSIEPLANLKNLTNLAITEGKFASLQPISQLNLVVLNLENFL